jgi:predicted 2-oxoglutarate/Fe(II)-dependent dioxygenase YbiX
MYAGHFDFARPLIQVVPGLIPAADCRRLIDDLAGVEWLQATVNTRAGRAVNDRLRNNGTALIRDDAVAAALWARIAAHVPETMAADWDGGRRVVRALGLHRPLRIYRYQVGQQFGLHNDQSYAGPGGSRSLLTLLVYLDDDMDGGETEFPEQGQIVTPRAGDALWFQHMVLHAGRAVTRGVKHVLRTDVLYAPTASDVDASGDADADRG